MHLYTLGRNAALTVQNGSFIGDKESKTFAYNVMQHIEDNHATDSAHSTDEGSGDDKNTSNNETSDSEEINSSGNDFDDKHNTSILTKPSERDTEDVSKPHKDGNILLSDHVIFLLGNQTNLDNSTNTTYQDSSKNNKTKSKFLTVSRIYGLGEKTDRSLLDNSSNFSGEDYNNDTENLSNLHNLIKDLVSLDKSIYLVEHTLNMADGHNKSTFNRMQLNNDKLSTDQSSGQENEILSESEDNSTNSGDNTSGMTNETMDKVHANVEDLVLRCLGFDSRDKLSPLGEFTRSSYNSSTNDSDIASTVHTSTGDLVLSCSDFDISNNQVAMLQPSTSQFHGENNDNGTTMPFLGNVLKAHSLRNEQNKINQVNASHNTTHDVLGNDKKIEGTVNKKVRNMKKSSAHDIKHKHKQSQLENFNQSGSHSSGDKKIPAGKYDQAKNQSSHGIEDNNKQNHYLENSPDVLFKYFGIHNGTDPRLRDLINDVINLDNSTTYYYSYSSKPNNRGAVSGNNTGAKLRPHEGDKHYSHKHVTTKYHNHGYNKKKKGVNTLNHVGDTNGYSTFSRDLPHNTTSSGDLNADGDKRNVTNAHKYVEGFAVKDNKTIVMAHNKQGGIGIIANATSSQARHVNEDFKNVSKIHNNMEELVSHIYSRQSEEQRDSVNKTVGLVHNIAKGLLFLDNTSTLQEPRKINGTILTNIFVATPSHAYTIGDRVAVDNKTATMAYSNDERKYFGYNSTTSANDNESTGTNIYNDDKSNETNIHNDDKSNETNIINDDKSNETNIINDDKSNETNIINDDKSNETNMYNDDQGNETNMYNDDQSNETNMYNDDKSNETNMYNDDKTNETNMYNDDQSNETNMYNDDKTNETNMYNDDQSNETNMYNDDQSNETNMYNDDKSNETNMYNDDQSNETNMYNDDQSNETNMYNDDKSNETNMYNDFGDINPNGYTTKSDYHPDSPDNQTGIMLRNNNGVISDSDNPKQQKPGTMLKNWKKMTSHEGDLVLHDNFAKPYKLDDADPNKTAANKLNTTVNVKDVSHNTTISEYDNVHEGRNGANVHNDVGDSTKFFTTNGNQSVGNHPTSADIHRANNHNVVGGLPISGYSNMANGRNGPTHKDKGNLNRLPTSQNYESGNDKRKESGNLVFQDYLMNTSGHSVAIGNITMRNENIRFFNNSTVSDDRQSGYDKDIGHKHDYVTGVLISHGYDAAKSKISAYKARNNISSVA